MRPRKAVRFECPECGEYHEDRDSAAGCCVPTIEPIDGFVCDECDEWYEDRDEAKDCCR